MTFPLFNKGLFKTAPYAVAMGFVLLYVTPAMAYLDVQMNEKTKRLNIEAQQEPLASVISALASAGGLNIMLDDTVQGNATLQLHGVQAKEALGILCRMYGLTMQPEGGNIWLVTSREGGRERGLYQHNTEMLSLTHASAAWMAQLLNQALFGQGGGNAQNARVIVRANERTNALVISGTQDEIALVKRLSKELDVQRDRRVYQLSYAHAVDVARQLEAAIFGVRNMPRGMGAAGGMAGAGGGAGMAGGGAGMAGGGAGMAGGAGMPNMVMLNETQPQLREGVGAGEITATESSSGDVSEQNTMNQADISIRSSVLQPLQYAVNTMGAIVLPNSKLNTLTVIATGPQLAQVEDLLPMLDAKPPQVSIQADLVEVSSTGLKELGFQVNYSEGGGPWSAVLGALTPGVVNNIAFVDGATNPDIFNLQIQALIQQGKAKSVASPSVVASHDSETIINITDQILRGESFTAAGQSQFFGETTPLLGQAGITLDILPKIGGNGNITLRVRPMVTSVYTSVSSGTATVELVRSRDLAAQAVNLKDGQSMVIGGLIDTRSSSTEQKIPGLGDLPVLGALFRATRQSTLRSELLIIVTPKILNKLEPMPIHRLDAHALSAPPRPRHPQGFPQKR